MSGKGDTDELHLGAIAMSLSTIIVVANEQLLRRLKLQRTALQTLTLPS
jgi:cation transport ATPase